MRPKIIAALLAATALVAAYGSPAGATAARPSRILKQRASVSAQFELRGTHGFRLSLFTSDKGGALLSASRRTSGLGLVSVYYLSFRRQRRPSFAAGRLDFRIGRLGRFRGRFIPTRTEKQNLPECKGDPSTIEHGFFVGSFDFRGEQGYTVAHSHRVRASVTRQPAGTCTSKGGRRWHESRRESKESKERERAESRLVATDEQADVLFDAWHREAIGDQPPQTTCQVTVSGKRVGGVEVGYSAIVLDTHEREPGATFQVPNLAEPLAEVTLTPPTPFSGSATFHLDDPKTASWTGDLAVELPGLGEVPLTGDGIEAGLCKSSSCTRTLPKNLQPVLEADDGAIVSVSAATARSTFPRRVEFQTIR